MLPEDLRRSRINGLKKQFDLLTEKLTRLRSSVAIETDITVKYKLEHQIKETEEERAEIQNLIQNIMDTPTDSNETSFLLNRILLSLFITIFLLIILYLYSSIADAIVAIIGLIAGFIIFLFPGIKTFKKANWFRKSWVSFLLISLIFLLIIGGYFLAAR